ncbi:hypothetical protein BC830DRAFT_1118801 [Chytriomyces sp. MP71]|nr:hypothetical protein BC830DRAFT_1118801 [Chytriomyces sp. MP71]
MLQVDGLMDERVAAVEGMAEFSCALVRRGMLVQGRMVVSENHLLFYANILRILTEEKRIPLADIISVQKTNAALIFPTSIKIRTLSQSFTFTSFLSRDSAHKTIAVRAAAIQRNLRQLPQGQQHSQATKSSAASKSIRFIARSHSASSLIPSKSNAMHSTVPPSPAVVARLSEYNTSALSLFKPGSLASRRNSTSDTTFPFRRRKSTTTTIATNSASSQPPTPTPPHSPPRHHFNTHLHPSDASTSSHHPESEGAAFAYSFDGFAQTRGLLHTNTASLESLLKPARLSRRSSIASMAGRVLLGRRQTVPPTTIVARSRGSSVSSGDASSRGRVPIWSMASEGGDEELRALRRRGRRTVHGGGILRRLSNRRGGDLGSSSVDEGGIVAPVAIRVEAPLGEEEEVDVPGAAAAAEDETMRGTDGWTSSAWDSEERGRLDERALVGGGAASKAASARHRPQKLPLAGSTKRRSLRETTAGSSGSEGLRFRRRSRSAGRHRGYVEAAASLAAAAAASKQAALEPVTMKDMDPAKKPADNGGMEWAGGWFGGGTGLLFGVVAICFALLLGSLLLLMRVNTVLTQLETAAASTFQ